MTPLEKRADHITPLPAANLPDASILPLTSLSLRGVYYGFALVHPTPQHGISSSLPGHATPSTALEEEDTKVWPMVMSVGWNPYYKNERLTAVRLPLVLCRLACPCLPRVERDSLAAIVCSSAGELTSAPIRCAPASYRPSQLSGGPCHARVLVRLLLA